ncbi:LysR family transcriptional regulator [Miniphocaeibacter massiliensis]|uniref:LysR family transcriptional regulator n=1 Tax=Miniphocaeibacter massiliensis TaxID=2041841 RepID=UPI000C1C12AA|nr:LysR family transcriptional regulator [Miniphocaeibacter massiliensis]
MFTGIEYVYEVYKERSFSKAANNLYISQPSLSGTIKRIEKEIGYDIFDRSTKPIGITEIGMKYIKTIEGILQLESNFSEYINDVEDLKAGKVGIGGTHQYTSYMLPPIVSEFIKRYPKINIDIIEAKSSNLMKYLDDGTIDIAIDNYKYDETEYCKQFQQKDNILLAVPKRMKSNKAVEEFALKYEDVKSGRFLEHEVDSIPLKIFENDPFILLKEGNDTRKRANKKLIYENIKPKVILEIEQQITSYNLTSYGIGISFISDFLIKNVGPNPNINLYKLNNYESDRDISFYYKRNKFLNKAVKEFLKIVKEVDF